MNWVHKNILPHVEKDYPELDIDVTQLENLLRVMESSKTEDFAYTPIYNKKNELVNDSYSIILGIGETIFEQLKADRYQAILFRFYTIKRRYNPLNFELKKEYNQVIEDIRKYLGIENIINFNEGIKNYRYNLLLKKGGIILGGKGGYLVIEDNLNPQLSRLSANKQAVLIAKTYHKIRKDFESKIREAKTTIENIRALETHKFKQMLS